jgi:hypothetical protein
MAPIKRTYSKGIKSMETFLLLLLSKIFGFFSQSAVTLLGSVIALSAALKLRRSMRLIGLCALSFIYAAPAWSQDAPHEVALTIKSKVNGLSLQHNRVGNKASLERENGSNNQFFYIQPIENDRVKIMSVSGEMCMSAIDDGITRILDFTQCEDKENQQFQLELINQDDKTFTISFTNDQGKSKCLDVYKANLGTWDCNMGQNQRFIITSLVSEDQKRRLSYLPPLKVPSTLAEFRGLFQARGPLATFEYYILFKILPTERIFQLVLLSRSERNPKTWREYKEEFRRLLIDPLRRGFNNGLHKDMAEWIANELFRKEPSLVDNCPQYDHDFLLMQWIKIRKKFPLEPKDKDDYPLIRWIHEHLASKHPKLIPSIEDMLSDNPTERIETQSRAFFLLYQEHIKRSISEEDMKKLWGKKELGEVLEAPSQALADSLCMDKPPLEDFLQQLVQTTNQQGQKNLQAFKDKYQVNFADIMPLFSSEKYFFRLVGKEKGTHKIRSGITIFRNSTAFTLVMPGKNMYLVLAVSKNSANEVSFDLMINGQTVQDALAKYYPDKDRYEISSVLNPLQERINMLIKMTENGSPAMPIQKKKAYNSLFKAAHEVRGALFCPPEFGRHLEGGSENCEPADNEEEAKEEAEENIDIELQVLENVMTGRTSQAAFLRNEQLEGQAQPMYRDTFLNRIQQIFEENHLNRQHSYELQRVRSEVGPTEYYVRRIGGVDNQIVDQDRWKVDIEGLSPAEYSYLAGGQISHSYPIIIEELGGGQFTVECERETCAICHFTLFEFKDNIAITNCGHAFHKDCIRESLTNSYQCPICRTQLTQEFCQRFGYTNEQRERAERLWQQDSNSEGQNQSGTSDNAVSNSDTEVQNNNNADLEGVPANQQQPNNQPGYCEATFIHGVLAAWWLTGSSIVPIQILMSSSSWSQNERNAGMSRANLMYAAYAISLQSAACYCYVRCQQLQRHVNFMTALVLMPAVSMMICAVVNISYHMYMPNSKNGS